MFGGLCSVLDRSGCGPAWNLESRVCQVGSLGRRPCACILVNGPPPCQPTSGVDRSGSPRCGRSAEVQLMHVLARAVQERHLDLPPWWLPQPNGKEIVKSLPPLLLRSFGNAL